MTLKPTLTFACTIIAAGMGGCANLNSIHHEFQTPLRTDDAQGKAVAVDVKQRFLAMSIDPKSNAVSTDGKVPSPSWVMCAEPSPDALAAYSGSLAGNAQLALPSTAGTKEIAAAVAAAFAEQAAAFGLRTQSITLLRDSAFRLCEGFMNKSLNARQFDILHRRLQNIMVATLAIEQVTGYARPTVATLGGSASASAAGHAKKALDDLTKAKKAEAAQTDAADTAQGAADKATAAGEKAKKDLEDLKVAATAAATKAATDAKALADAKAALEKLPATATADQRKTAEDLVAKAKTASEASDAAKVAADKKVTDQTDVVAKADAATKKAVAAADAADKALEDAKASTQLAQDAFDAAKGLAADATGTAAQFSAPESPAPVDAKVARVVEGIVKLAIDRDYTKDTCLDYLVGHLGKFDEQVKAVCINLMNAVIDGIKQETSLLPAGRDQPKARLPTLPPMPQPSGSFERFNR